MTNQRTHQLRRLYGILLSIVLAAAGICLMVACYRIYTTGDGVFSREIVAAHFAEIGLPVYLCLVMVILGFLLDIFLPGEKTKGSIEKNYLLILQRLHAKTDLDQCASDLRSAVLKEQKARKCHKIVSIVLLIIGSILFLSYGLNGNNFHQREITPSLIRAMYLLIPCMSVPFGYAVFTAYYSRTSIRREIDLLKQAGSNRAPAPAEETKPRKSAHSVRWAVLAVAVVILIYGYFSGGTADVLTKAINICTECVGLG